MSSFKSGNLNVSVYPVVKRSTSACVLFGLDCGKADSSLFLHLKNNFPIHSCNEEDLTVLFYCMYELIYTKMKSIGSDPLGNKIMCVDSCIHNGQLTISIVCANQNAVIKKVLNTVLRNFQFHISLFRLWFRQ